MPSIEILLQKLPYPIRPLIAEGWLDYQCAVKEQYSQIPHHVDFLPSLCRVWASSNFVMHNCIRQPNVILDLFESGDVLLEYPKGEYEAKLEILLKRIKKFADLEITLREFRLREMLRIAWRDLARWTTPTKTMNDLSALADAIINLANKKLFSWQCEQLGMPLDPETKTMMPLLVLAMGKLGAYELNFSSDIDLIYCYPKDGELPSGKTFSEFYLRLARQLTNLLNKVTKDGFVYRVDLRLRPFGSSGSLVCSANTLINYYQTHGREWERYALVKARIINYEAHYSATLLQTLRQFVYRSYIDYSAIESLRHLQQKITLEVRKHNLEKNIKRGPGGIREIEFISQTYKIIRGGRHHRLQDRNTLKSLILLREIRSINQDEFNQLTNAYLYLRNVENKLQMFNDKQTHALPTDSLCQARIAYAMNYISWTNFTNALEKHRNNVQFWFDKLIAKPSLSSLSNTNKQLEKAIKKLWQQPTLIHDNALNQIITDLNYNDSDDIARFLVQLHDYTKQQHLSKTAKRHLDVLFPRIMILIATMEQPDRLFRRMLPLIESIITHSIYLVLLIENPIVLSQAINLCSASPWIADELAKHPFLLDELLDPTNLYAPPSSKRLRFLLNKQLKAISNESLERKVEAVCWFKQIHLLKVAAADVTGTLRLMRISDYLTDIATVVLDKIRELILQDLIKTHGNPSFPRKYKQQGFAIIAYGKLGGIELSYSSDLDLIFLHPQLDPQAMTQGDNPISNQKFYLRLGQRIVKTLSQKYTCGSLYVADLRLRPAGNAGLIVNSVQEFANYQQSQAWNWEHQALVRSRPISGAPAVGLQFDKIREKILSQKRNQQQLKQHIVDMRNKMRANKLQHVADKFDIKQGEGGLVDIEFIAQYAVLSWSYEFPSLLEYPDNVRIFERVGMEGLMRMKEIQILTDAYKAYRGHLHKAALQNQPGLIDIDNDDVLFYRIAVKRIWEQIFSSSD